MMDFHASIIISTLALSLLKHCEAQPQQDPQQYCQTYDAHHESFTSCCNGQAYSLGHNNLAAVQFCYSKPPDDPTMSYVDSKWNFYCCIVNQTLASLNLNLTLFSYAQMMARNLKEDSRSELMSFVVERTVKPHLFGNELIKYLWKVYFDIDFYVCGKKFDPDEFTVQAAYPGQKGLRLYWEPTKKCETFQSPHVVEISSSAVGRCYWQCMQTLANELQSLREFLNSGMHMFCSCFLLVGNTLDDISKFDFNLTSCVMATNPKYFSTTAIGNITARVNKVLRQDWQFDLLTEENATFFMGERQIQRFEPNYFANETKERNHTIWNLAALREIRHIYSYIFDTLCDDTGAVGF